MGGGGAATGDGRHGATKPAGVKRERMKPAM
jgi:hypothetical protein